MPCWQYYARRLQAIVCALSLLAGFAPLAIAAPPSPPAITSANNATFVVGQAGSFTFTATGSPAPTFALSGCTLPAALTLNANSGVLSGTPASGKGGVYNCTLTATNNKGSGTQAFTLTVNEAPVFTSANGATFIVGQAGSFTVTATGYPAPSVSLTGCTLPPGISFTAATRVLSGTPAAGAGGNYACTFSAQNGVGSASTQSFTLTVKQAPAITSANSARFNVGQAGSFTVTATGYPTPSLSLSGCTLPSGVTFTAASGVLAGTPASGTGGNYVCTFTAANGVGTGSTQAFTLTVGQGPAITSANNAAFTVGQAGSFSFTATGFPAPTYSLSGCALPSGLSLNATTGTLSGTPATGTGGSYACTLTATNSGGSATQAFGLTVKQAPNIVSADSSNFSEGEAGSFTVAATGYPTPSLSLSGCTLPSGLSFTSSSGTLTGTPAIGTAGVYSCVITAQNGVGTSSVQNHKLTVHPAALTPPTDGGPTTSIVEYHYDEVGNIVSIGVSDPLQVQVISFAPTEGPVGTRVVVTGSNFHADPAWNKVFVNGTAAQVVAASPQRLEFIVPEGATSGPISVTVAGQTAQSTGMFSVLEFSAPVITDFTPKVGAAGTSIAVIGENFYAIGAPITARLGIAAATVSPGTNKSLGVTVPSGTGTGRIVIQTAKGTATSASYFYVPPSPYTPEQVTTTGLLTLGRPQQVTLNQPGSVAMFALEVRAPSAAGIKLTGSTLSSGTLLLLSPSGATVASANISTAGASIPVTSFSESGTYSIVVAASAGNSGSATVEVGAEDLAISNLTVGAITFDSDGNWLVPATYTVTNVGSATAQASWHDFAAVSSKSSVDATAVPVMGVHHQSTALAPGESYTKTQTFTVQHGIVPGNYTFFVKTDAKHPNYYGGSYTDAGWVRETDETNNAVGVSIELKRPDLAISNLTVGTITVQSDGSWLVPATYTVTNVGSVAALPSWHDFAAVSSKSSLDSTAVPVMGVHHQSTALAPGESYTKTQTFTVPHGIVPGNYTFFVKTDAKHPNYYGGSYTDAGWVRETDETNNAIGVSIVLSR